MNNFKEFVSLCKGVHMNIKSYQCHLCPRALKDARSLKRHLVCKHQVMLSEKEMASVSKDISRVAAIKAVEPKCDQCDKLFPTELDFDDHMKKCHTLKCDIEFRCNKCDTMWSASQSLHYHIYHTHNVGDVVCDICGQIIKSSHYLKKHKQSVHMLIKEWPCDQCGKLYSSKESLNRHIEAIHMKLKKYSCEMCDFKSTSMQRVRIHTKKFHSKDPMPFKCDKCEFETDGDKKLRRHRTKFHPIKRAPKIVIATD